MARIPKPVKNPIGHIKSSVKGKIQNWNQYNVFSDEETKEIFHGFDTYTKEEVDSFLLDKANKIVPQSNHNFSMLKADGDLNDAGFGIADLTLPDIVNGGTF